MRLVIVTCGQKKIWGKRPSTGPTKAKDAFVSDYFKTNREYAETIADDWLIYSTKYGLISPEKIIGENYEVEPGSSEEVEVDVLRTQIAEKELGKFDEVEILCGKDIAKNIREAFTREGIRGSNITEPLRGLDFGARIKKVESAISRGVSLNG